MEIDVTPNLMFLFVLEWHYICKFKGERRWSKCQADNMNLSRQCPTAQHVQGNTAFQE